MIVKPAIQWLNTDSDAALINDSNVVLQALTDNASIYTTPIPPLAEVQTSLDNLTEAVAVAADGGPSSTARKNNLRRIHAGLMRQLASYVQVACKNDMTNLLLSGFPVQKPVRQPIGVLPAPGNVTLSLGTRSGELAATANPVFGASVYNWQLMANSPGASVQTVQSTAAKCVFTGLTPGVIYKVTVNAVGSAGPSDWSNPAEQMTV